MSRCDVLVVGAGPAGSLAALILARAGIAVRLIDRATFPRDKLCGDTLNPGSMAILDRHGLAACVRARALPISGMTVTGPGAAVVSSDYPNGVTGVSLTRRDLDHLLLSAAIDAGATFEDGRHVVGPARDAAGKVTGVRMVSGEMIPATVTLAADGRASRLGAAVGLTRFARAPRRWAFGAYYQGVDRLTSQGEMHVRGDGYVGVAPLPGGIANVCVVHELRRGMPVTDPASTLQAAVSSDSVLRDRFGAATRVSPMSVLGPLAVEARGSGVPGLLLAGDAAGFVDPMTGDGLRFALRGAELAADAVMQELANGRPAFASLHRARAREFSGKWRVNRGLRALVGAPRTLGLAAALARVWPDPVEYLIGLAGDIPRT